MNNLEKEQYEYEKFWIEFYQKTAEIMEKYNMLSAENRKRAIDTAQKIIISQGIKGVVEYGKKYIK